MNVEKAKNYMGHYIVDWRSDQAIVEVNLLVTVDHIFFFKSTVL